MLLLYSIGIRLYHFAVYLASWFNPKAKQFCKGRKHIFKHASAALAENDSPVIWFHCSSFGEFEQGKPVLYQLKKNFPQHRIVLTFFSPSGYVQGIKDTIADAVFYLPADSVFNARNWINILNPTLAVFVKYDFWFHYMNELSRRQIPFVYVSAIFRRDQYFFKPWAKSFLRILQKATAFYVQDATSAALLNQHHISQVFITGDTRFDRVIELPEMSFDDEHIKAFAANSKLLVAGSTWAPDHRLLAKYVNQHNSSKLLLVPHEISSAAIDSFVSVCQLPVIRYSEVKHKSTKELSAAHVLIVDQVGMLSRLYRFATVCYIGGGFGAGIHNILEAAVYGKPVVFGPNFQKFKEARELISSGGAFSISNYQEMEDRLNYLMNQQESALKSGQTGQTYVKTHAGATMAVVSQLSAFLK
jgi:3-deoxy-D-manno-octulosonic-acid transferase